MSEIVFVRRCWGWPVALPGIGHACVYDKMDFLPYGMECPAGVYSTFNGFEVQCRYAK